MLLVVLCTLFDNMFIQVYGETSFELIAEVIKHTKLSENDVFVDLGSGESYHIHYVRTCKATVRTYNLGH